jgi:hypothetical protein
MYVLVFHGCQLLIFQDQTRIGFARPASGRFAAFLGRFQPGKSFPACRVTAKCIFWFKKSRNHLTNPFCLTMFSQIFGKIFVGPGFFSQAFFIDRKEARGTLFLINEKGG